MLNQQLQTAIHDVFVSHGYREEVIETFNLDGHISLFDLAREFDTIYQKLKVTPVDEYYVYQRGQILLNGGTYEQYITLTRSLLEGSFKTEKYRDNEKFNELRLQCESARKQLWDLYVSVIEEAYSDICDQWFRPDRKEKFLRHAISIARSENSTFNGVIEHLDELFDKYF